MGCFPVDFQEVKRPLRTKSVKRPIKVGKRPINEGKRPIKAKVLVGVSVGCLMGCFRAPPPWRKTAPLKRPIKRSMILTHFSLLSVFFFHPGPSGFGRLFADFFGEGSCGSSARSNFSSKWMQLFCLQLEASRLQWSFLLTVDNFGFFAYNWSFFAYSFSFVTHSWSFFACSGKVRLIRALRDCKRRSLTVSKTAPTVSKKAKTVLNYYIAS